MASWHEAPYIDPVRTYFERSGSHLSSGRFAQSVTAEVARMPMLTVLSWCRRRHRHEQLRHPRQFAASGGSYCPHLSLQLMCRHDISSGLCSEVLTGSRGRANFALGPIKLTLNGSLSWAGHACGGKVPRARWRDSPHGKQGFHAVVASKLVRIEETGEGGPVDPGHPAPSAPCFFSEADVPDGCSP